MCASPRPRTPLDRTRPRPTSWEALALLWAWVEAVLGSTYTRFTVESLAIFPVTGQDYLVHNDGLVRPPERPVKVEPAAWEELLSLQWTLDPGWPEWLDQEPGESKTRQRLAEAGSKILKQAKLESPTRLATLFERAAEQIFGQQTDRAQAIRLTRLLAAAEIDTPENWRWWNGAGELCTGRWRLLNGASNFEELLPEGWLAENTISPEYFDVAHPEFTEWAKSKRSGLLPFPFPRQQQATGFRDREHADAWARSRGAQEPLSQRLASAAFETQDWDFEASLWTHWHSCLAENRGFALRLLSAIFSLPAEELRRRSTAQIVQFGRSRYYTVAQGLRAGWVERLRDEEWLPDEFGRPARPYELLRRTKDTQAFVGSERFLHSDLDKQEHADLFDLLGVQSRGWSADTIFERLAAIAGTGSPELSERLLLESGKWLEALDRFLSMAGLDEVEGARRRFATESLIPDEDRIPRRSGEVVRENPEKLSVPVVHPSLERPMLWERLGIRFQPSEEELLKVVEGLHEGEPLPEGELGRARRILARFPREVLQRTGRWLDATSAMRTWGDLRHSTSAPGGRVAHLFLAKQRTVADLSMLSPEVRESGDFRSLAPIDRRLSDRALAQGATYRTRDAGSLCAVGRFLEALAECGWPAELRALGARLASAGIPIFEELHAAPFLDGEQVGEAHPVPVAWGRDRLVLRADRQAVQDREMALFLEGEIRAALGAHERAAELAHDVAHAVGRPESYVEELFAARYGIELAEEEEERMEEGEEGEEEGGEEKEEREQTPLLPPPPKGLPELEKPELEREDLGPGEGIRRPRYPLIERLARALDFERAGATFLSPAKDRELRTAAERDSPLPFEIVRHPRGEVLLRLCVVEARRNGFVEIAAESWRALEGLDSCRLVVLMKNGESLQYSGRDLARLKSEKQLEVFAATYRLWFRGGSLDSGRRPRK